MDGDQLVLVRDVNDGSRKKKNKTVSNRKASKQAKYRAPSGCNVFTPCTHNNKTLKCNKIRPRDAIEFRKKLYSFTEKQQQDEYVSRMICQSKVKRNRPRSSLTCLGLGLPKRDKPHNFTSQYKFRTSTGENVTVCKKHFLHLTKFSSDRVRQILKKLVSGKPFKECRGGDRVSKKSVLKKESVRIFIGNLKGNESHYNRKKSKRIYLQSDLSIRKLCNMYNSSTNNPNLQVKLSMFRRIFCTEFNIGFRSPASDVCSYCTMLDNKLKTALASEKQPIITEKRIHKLRAKSFYEAMRKPAQENEIKICFDMQQVQPLPRTPIQQAFYSRQLGLYNVCVMNIITQNPSFFVWTEDQAARGSTEVASALLNYLNNIDLTGVERISLFSDGCIGQNKNNHVLHALMHFLAKDSDNLKLISLTFPVRGHSFLPADRMFGQVEKYLRKKPTILHKAEYVEEIEKVGLVKQLGRDWELLDVKSLNNNLKNFPDISEQKRLLIGKKLTKSGDLRIEVQGHKFYRFEENTTIYTLLKKGYKWSNILKTQLNTVPLIHTVSAAKKKDISELLNNLFDKGWEVDESLSWYKKVCFDIPEGEDQDSDNCDCLEPDCAIHV